MMVGRFALRRVLTSALLTLAVAAPLPSQTASPPPSPAQVQEIIAIMARSYVRSVPADSLALVVSSGRFALLDPYTRYLDASAWAALQRTIWGTYGGLGVRLKVDSSGATARVIGVYAGSPGERAGLLPNDVIVAVDGRDTRGRTLEQYVDALVGPIGSTVALTIRRAGSAQDLQVPVVRARIWVPTVRGVRRGAHGWDYMLDDRSHVGYIHIEHFARDTPEELDSAIASVIAAHAVALVLDVRDNRGGLVPAAVGVADRFLDSGVISTLEYRRRREVYRAKPGVATTLPLALLIGEGSASSTELLAAALQDQRRAIVIGTRTFGKGHSQDVLPLTDGHSALRLTTAEFFGPSHRRLERHFPDEDSTMGGVRPDSGMTVSMTDDELHHWQRWEGALDDLMGLPDGQGVIPAPVPDRVLERAVAVLLAQLHR
jgi:carboxyl-terminal processing protease